MSCLNCDCLETCLETCLGTLGMQRCEGVSQVLFEGQFEHDSF